MNITVLAIAVIILCSILLKDEIYEYMGWQKEDFGYCPGCSHIGISKEGTPVINPYIWPFSGTDCIDDIYAVNKLDDEIPLTHASTPDHVVLTN